MPAEGPGELVAVLLCGGRGMRAWPLTEEIPKPLLPVGGGPALAQLVEIYAQQGVRRFVMATGYKGEAVRALGRVGHLLGGGRRPLRRHRRGQQHR